MSNETKKSHRINVRMTDEEMEELELNSYFEDMSKSEYVRRAIISYNTIRQHAPELLKAYMKGVNEHE